MPGEPRILAGFVQGTLDTVVRHEQATGRAITERLPAETLARVRSALPVSWLPLRDDVAITESLFEAVGEEGAKRIFRDAMAGSMDKGFLGPLVRGAVALLGRRPDRLLRWAPKVWFTIYRDAGELVYAEEAAGARLEILRAPALLAEHRPYMVGSAAAVEGGMAALGCEVSCELQALRPRPILAVRWKPEPL